MEHLAVGPSLKTVRKAAARVRFGIGRYRNRP